VTIAEETSLATAKAPDLRTEVPGPEAMARIEHGYISAPLILLFSASVFSL